MSNAKATRAPAGHHLLPDGRFQSDKHPDLPPDRIRVNFANPLSWRALAVLADDYEAKDPALAADIRARLAALGYKHEAYGDYVLGRAGRPVARMLTQTPAFGGCERNADDDFRDLINRFQWRGYCVTLPPR